MDSIRGHNPSLSTSLFDSKSKKKKQTKQNKQNRVVMMEEPMRRFTKTRPATGRGTRPDRRRVGPSSGRCAAALRGSCGSDPVAWRAARAAHLGRERRAQRPRPRRRRRSVRPLDLLRDVDPPRNLIGEGSGVVVVDVDFFSLLPRATMTKSSP